LSWGNRGEALEVVECVGVVGYVGIYIRSGQYPRVVSAGGSEGVGVVISTGRQFQKRGCILNECAER